MTLVEASIRAVDNLRKEHISKTYRAGFCLALSKQIKRMQSSRIVYVGEVLLKQEECVQIVLDFFCCRRITVAGRGQDH